MATGYGKRIETAMVVAAVLAVCIVFVGGPTFAAGPDDLAKSASKKLRDAERLMHSGKNDDAVGGLADAAADIKALREASPNHNKLKSLDQTYTRTKAALDRKLGTGTNAASAAPAATAPPAAAASSEKLPGGVTHRLKQVERDLGKAEQRIADTGSVTSPKSRLDQAQYAFDGAMGTWKEIQEKFAGTFAPDHPDVKATETHIEEVRGQIAAFSAEVSSEVQQAADSASRKQVQSDTWLAKFGPYLDRSGDKYLFSRGVGVADVQAKKADYDDARKLFDEYKATAFPDGKTPDLELAEKDFAYMLETFGQNFESRQDDLLGNAEQLAARERAYLENESWKNDPKAMPPVLSGDRITALGDMIDQAAGFQGVNQGRIASLKESYGHIVKLDRDHQGIRAERTRVIPDKYKAGDAKEVKAKADDLVKKKHAGIKVLRSTVINEDWKEETVQEWTDTTKTALRVRTTRSINAQVAGKIGNEVRLFTVYVAKDRHSDGSWSSLYGNLHSDRGDLMLEQNVSK